MLRQGHTPPHTSLLPDLSSINTNIVTTFSGVMSVVMAEGPGVRYHCLLKFRLTAYCAYENT